MFPNLFDYHNYFVMLSYSFSLYLEEELESLSGIYSIILIKHYDI